MDTIHVYHPVTGNTATIPASALPAHERRGWMAADTTPAPAPADDRIAPEPEPQPEPEAAPAPDEPVRKTFRKTEPDA